MNVNGSKNKAREIFGTFSCIIWNVNGICSPEIAVVCVGLLIMIVGFVAVLRCCDPRMMELLTHEHVYNYELNI
jgi:Flp pilus assembly protein TadB